MRHLQRSFLAALVILMLPAAASAGHTVCVGLLIGSFENVVVPPGATCDLVDSTVDGNVKALKDSRLAVVNTTVGGNVKGDEASSVQVIQSTVGGNVKITEGHDPLISSAVVQNSLILDGNIEIEKGRFPFGDWLVEANAVRNIKVEKNEAGADLLSFVQLNDVARNVHVLKNEGPGLKEVTGNTVGRNLQCKKNDQPFVGGPNTAQRAEGQCF
jgi:hypothetical protein